MAYTKVSYEERPCKWCNNLFTPNRRDKMFCSAHCCRKYGKKYLGHSNGTGLRNREYRRHLGKSCELCGFIPINKCQLDVDHKDGVHSNNSPDNLQTLCANCHRLKTFLNRDWEIKKDYN